MPEPPVHRYVVGRARDIPDGGRLIVEIGGRSIGIFNVDGAFYALLNRCPHQGGALCEGELLSLVESDRPGDIRVDADTRLIACPWHGWEFDLTTGRSWFNPERTRVRTYNVERESGGVAHDLLERKRMGNRVEGPLQAEVVPVEVAEDYLVVSLSSPGGTG
jgi:3-phenylpropionate/trans-cinnamate dioxygenase ferredoxin subunit